MRYDNVSVDGKVGFKEIGHKYSLLTNDKFKFKSVTTIIKDYHEKFDELYHADRMSKKKTSVYYGKDPKDIIDLWKRKAKKAADEGTLLHAYGEDLLNNKKDLTVPKHLVKSKWVPKIVTKLYNDGYKLAKTELLVYSEVLNLAGQSDILFKKLSGHTDIDKKEIYDYFIFDWKFLGKKIEMKSYYNPYTRQYKKMMKPFHHLLDCNWIHYSIQLAIYQTLTGEPSRVKEKVLVIVNDDEYNLVPCYPMRVFWDESKQLQAVYEIFNGKVYDSRIDKIINKWPGDIKGR